MIVQLFRALRPERDVYIAVQVAPSTLDAEALGERLGADDVFRDDALEALSRFNDSTFDVVIDCIGGKRVYEAARRTLRADGTFATLVGDSPGSGNTEKRTFASNLRSLRSAFKRREHKRVNYWMPMLAVMDRESPLQNFDAPFLAFVGFLETDLARNVTHCSTRLFGRGARAGGAERPGARSQQGVALRTRARSVCVPTAAGGITRGESFGAMSRLLLPSFATCMR